MDEVSFVGKRKRKDMIGPPFKCKLSTGLTNWKLAFH